MKVGDDVKTMGRACWSCGKVNDAATVIGEEGFVYPKENDIAICFYCGNLGVFDGRTVRALTTKELGDLIRSPLWDTVQRGLMAWSKTANTQRE